jgi:endonuclease/exonuclease/phosphatase family metal-dependent hydrolase
MSGKEEQTSMRRQRHRLRLPGGQRLPLAPVLVIILLALVIATYLLISSRSVTNYTNRDGPKFEGSYAQEQPPFDGQLKAVTWNIAFAEEIEQALAELSVVQELQQADVIMLQEMDEVGTERIAQTLGYNYVYYPASVHSRHGKNFGNAVLSRWPIVDSAKIILPHQNPSNDQIRIATRATIDVDGRQIPVYSVHTETFLLGPQQRKDQIAAVAEEAEMLLAQEVDYAIIGGDFNTLTPDSMTALIVKMEEAGLKWVSRGAGETLDKAGVSVTLDHIFAANMTPLETGVFTGSDSSDHHPVWVILTLDELLEEASSN